MITLITVFTIAINLFAIVLNFKMLSGVDTSKKGIEIILSELILLLIINIVYSISASGVDTNVSRSFITFTFLGINMIIIGAPFAKQYSKKDTSEITDDEFKRNLIKILILAIIVFVVECFYINSIIA